MKRRSHPYTISLSQLSGRTSYQTVVFLRLSVCLFWFSCALVTNKKILSCLGPQTNKTTRTIHIPQQLVLCYNICMIYSTPKMKRKITIFFYVFVLFDFEKKKKNEKKQCFYEFFIFINSRLRKKKDKYREKDAVDFKTIQNIIFLSCNTLSFMPRSNFYYDTIFIILLLCCCCCSALSFSLFFFTSFFAKLFHSRPIFFSILFIFKFNFIID